MWKIKKKTASKNGIEKGDEVDILLFLYPDLFDLCKRLFYRTAMTAQEEMTSERYTTYNTESDCLCVYGAL